MEASNGAHFWAKALSDLGHDVRLISPQFVTPYVKSNKNDRNDAEAICEAVGRHNMRFVPVKSAEQLAVQAVHRIRTGLVADRVRLVNQVRGLLGEHGIVVGKDIGNLGRALAGLGDNEDRALNPMVRALMGELREELTELDAYCGLRPKDPRALSQQRDLPASRQGRRDRPGDGDSAGRCGRRSKLVQERASVCGVAWLCSQAAIKWRPRQTIWYQQAWRPLSAHLADPRRSLCAWAGSRQAGSEKPVVRQDAAAATPERRRRRARQQECAHRLELARQRQRL